MIIFIGAGVSKLFGIPDTKGFIDILTGIPTYQATRFIIVSREALKEHERDSEMTLILKF